MSTQTIIWHKITGPLPDAETTVLLFNRDWNEPVFPGSLDQDGWRAYDGILLDGTCEGVGDITPPTHWAHMPTGPEVES